MKTVITTINAKYIHTSLALRWIYQACKDTCDIELIEFTIKEKPGEMAKTLLKHNPSHIGIGVYIWNVNQSLELIQAIKQLDPNIIITLGGPEVTYEPSFFLEHWPIDYIVSGEGEFVFKTLCEQLQTSKSIEHPSIASKEKREATPARAPIEQLELLDSPYQLIEDKEQLSKRIAYFETSRGCPYRCSYCLSSLEKGVRYFSRDWISKQLNYLFNHQVHTIKLLDRTFNLNHEHTMFVFEQMKHLDKGKTVCQFEIYADLLKPEMLDYLSTFRKHYLRFEIGIQSTHYKTNQAVDRLQDFQIIRHNIERLLKDDVVDLHLDLIAGLPFEDEHRFIQSFNEVFALKPQELQLGFLKMLRGTKLRHQSNLYDYKYDEYAPYEIISNKWLDEQALSRIKLVEEMLDRFYNSKRFIETFNTLMKESFDYFNWFLELGYHYLNHRTSYIGYQLDELFSLMNTYIHPKGDVLKALMIDYYSHFKVKPKRFMELTMSMDERKHLIQILREDTKWLENHGLNDMLLYKYSCFEKIGEGYYMIITYHEYACSIVFFSQ